MKIIIANDHPLVREGLRYHFNKIQGWQVVAEAENILEALQIVSLHLPDVLIIDVFMPGGYGIEIISNMKNKYPKMSIVIYTTISSEDLIYSALRAGASAYIDKSTRPIHIIEIIQSISKGERVESKIISEIFQKQGKHTPLLKEHHLLTNRCKCKNAGSRSDQLEEHNLLTSREKGVIKLVAEGLTNKQIGSSLGITERTVKQHIYHIVTKLQAQNRVHAVMIANRIGLL